MGSIIAYAIQAFSLIRAAVEAGMAVKDAYELIKKYEDNLHLMETEQRGPTDAEWDAINAESESIRAARPPVEE